MSLRASLSGSAMSLYTRTLRANASRSAMSVYSSSEKLIKFGRKMIPGLFRRSIPSLEIDNDAAHKKTMHLVHMQHVTASYIVSQDGEQIAKVSSRGNVFSDIGPAQAELYALHVLSRDFPDCLNVDHTKILINNQDNYLLMKGLRDQKPDDSDSILDFKMRASIHTRLKKKLVGRVDYFFIPGRANRADKEAKKKWKEVYDLKADELEVNNHMILHFLGNEGPKTSDPGKYTRYIHNWAVLENATIRACAVSTLAKFGALVESLKPRIFILLRRCLFDIDDEADPSTGEAEDDGVEDEYQLEDFEVVAADYALKVGVHDFKNVWDSGSRGRVDEYGLGTRESHNEQCY